MAIGQYSELKTAMANWLQGRTDLTSRIPEFITMAEDAMALDTRIRIRAMETQGTLVWKLDINGGTVGGTADAITLSAQVGTPAYGDSYTFTAGATNTTAVTINGTTLKNRYGGTAFALVAGDIIIGQSVRVYYDGTQWLLSPPSSALLPSDFLEFRSIHKDDTTELNIEFLSPDVFWGWDATTTTGTSRVFTIEGDWALLGPAAETTRYCKINYYRRFAALSAATDTNWLLTNARGIYLYGSLIQASPYLGDDVATITWASIYDDLVDKLIAADQMARFPSGKLTMRVHGWTP